MSPKQRGGKGPRDDKTVKIDRTLADKASFVASRRGTTSAEYLTELLHAAVERDFAQTVKEMQDDKPSKPKGPRGGDR